MKFKKDAEPVYSDDNYYDLFVGGYIKPEDFLSDMEEIKTLKVAMTVVQMFLIEAEELGLILEE